jgi:hypothetical protein
MDGRTELRKISRPAAILRREVPLNLKQVDAEQPSSGRSRIVAEGLF